MIQLELAPVAGIIRFRPALSMDETHLLDLKNWWDGEVIFRARESKITRKNLTLWARNTDGGAHIQSKHRTYQWLFSGGGWSMSLKPDGREPREVTAKNGHLAALRQIAFEVIHSYSVKSLWHPDWRPTHRITTKPTDNSVLPNSWDLMQFEGHAYSRNEWESHLDPLWLIKEDGQFQLLGEPPFDGEAGIQRIESMCANA